MSAKRVTICWRAKDRRLKCCCWISELHGERDQGTDGRKRTDHIWNCQLWILTLGSTKYFCVIILTAGKGSLYGGAGTKNEYRVLDNKDKRTSGLTNLLCFYSWSVFSGNALRLVGWKSILSGLCVKQLDTTGWTRNCWTYTNSNWDDWNSWKQKHWTYTNAMDAMDIIKISTIIIDLIGSRNKTSGSHAGGRRTCCYSGIRARLTVWKIIFRGCYMQYDDGADWVGSSWMSINHNREWWCIIWYSDIYGLWNRRYWMENAWYSYMIQHLYFVRALCEGWLNCSKICLSRNFYMSRGYCNGFSNYFCSSYILSYSRREGRYKDLLNPYLDFFFGGLKGKPVVGSYTHGLTLNLYGNLVCYNMGYMKTEEDTSVIAREDQSLIYNHRQKFHSQEWTFNKQLYVLVIDSIGHIDLYFVKPPDTPTTYDR